MRNLVCSVLAFLFLFCLCTHNSSGVVFAQESDFPGNVFEAQVSEILEEGPIKSEAENNYYQKIELRGTTDLYANKTFTSRIEFINENLKYKTGDQVVVSQTFTSDGKTEFIITDSVRRSSLFKLLLIFVVLAIIVGKLKGVTSLLGMILSFVVIMKFILPQIYNGNDPISTAIIGAIILVPITFILSHGFNKKTLIAIGGTLIALFLSAALANLFIDEAKITGLSSEEAGFVSVFTEGRINMKGLMLAGIIIGLLGVLDDVTVSQASIVEQLKEANPKLKFAQLYRKSMTVGRDHIASMINTLILVYAGASLPLLLLFLDDSKTFSQVINYEIVANEVIKTLTGSIGLILAVPITTFITSYVYDTKGGGKPNTNK